MFTANLWRTGLKPLQYLSMINRYTDHSANERTYLAWIRTAIAVMAFGFLIEKFDLFLAYLSQVMHLQAQKQAHVHLHSSRLAEWVGLGLIAAGVVMLIAATRHFYQYRRMIEAESVYRYGATGSSLLLSALLIMVALFLLLYLGHTLFSQR